MFSTNRYLVLLLIVVLAGCDLMADVQPARSSGKDPGVTVMTRNVYLGADFNVILGAQQPELVPLAVSQFFANVQTTNYPERAKALADEIAETRPHLIGLQEVALYRMQTPSDYVRGVFEPNAADVVLDFLAILQDELSSRELSYRVVNESVNVDEELPGLSATGLFDLRLTLRNVILARPNVRTTASESGTYAAEVVVSVGGESAPPPQPPPASFTRSYGWVDAVVAGVPFRFVNTHLETAAAAPIQEAQADELIAVLDDVKGPIILVGDFNSPADQSPPATYGNLTSTYTDAYASANPSATGFTCCQTPLLDEDSSLDRRIDLILYRGDIEVTWAQLVGETEEDRTASGLWPSDHAGVVAELKVDRKRPLDHSSSVDAAQAP